MSANERPAATGNVRVQGRLHGADAEEFARVLDATLDARRAHRGPCSQ
jgi:hypothetical protein